MAAKRSCKRYFTGSCLFSTELEHSHRQYSRFRATVSWLSGWDSLMRGIECRSTSKSCRTMKR